MNSRETEIIHAYIIWHNNTLHKMLIKYRDKVLVFFKLALSTFFFFL